jgi:hypothetical protein
MPGLLMRPLLFREGAPSPSNVMESSEEVGLSTNRTGMNIDIAAIKITVAGRISWRAAPLSREAENASPTCKNGKPDSIGSAVS